MWGFGACRGDGCECHNGGVPFCGMGRQHLFGGRLPPLFVSRGLGVAGAEVSEVGPLIGAYAFELGEKRLEVAGGCGDGAHAAGEGFAAVDAEAWALGRVSGSRPSIHLSMRAIVVPRWVAWVRMWVMTARASSSVGEWSARRSRTTRMARSSGVLVRGVSESPRFFLLVVFFSSSSSLRRGRGGAAVSVRPEEEDDSDGSSNGVTAQEH